MLLELEPRAATMSNLGEIHAVMTCDTMSMMVL